MKVLFVASEAHPFSKTGGLGDVAYALPKALRAKGVDVRVILPKYDSIPNNFKERMNTISEFNVQVGWRNQYCGLKYLEQDYIPFYFIDNEYYFKRPSPYGYYDEAERYAYFCKAVLQAINYMGDFKPDIIHCNDWQSGMISPLLNEFKKGNYIYNNIKTVFTVHNLQYQGVFPENILGEVLNLGSEYNTVEKLRHFDGISFMKGGLNFSNKLTTVSRTYAEEIKTPYYGEGLNGLLYTRGWDLVGIVNGIDYDLFNPETDKNIPYNYHGGKLYLKEKNKLELQKQLNLPINKDTPLIGIVSRLVKQKGFDLIDRILDELLYFDNIQIVVLGTGDSYYENMFKHFAWKYPNKLSANITFNNSLAQKIYAGSDMFLMPSLFEPCGIGQLIALRYGSIPIVRETGGLKDTVRSINDSTLEGNGFSFSNINAHDMMYTIRRAIWFYKDKKFWKELVERAMMEDNSWGKSAQKYIDLYYSLM